MSVEFENLQQKYKNKIASKTWYHGTLNIYLESLEEKILWDYNIGTELDFGPGFYLAPTFDIAKNFINVMFEYQKDFLPEAVKPIVVEMELPETVETLIQDNKFKFISFPKFDENFAEFILSNRLNPLEKVHDYDLIYGVMSDSNPAELVPKFKNKIITKADFTEQIVKKPISSRQLSIHNQKICDNIKVIQDFEV